MDLSCWFVVARSLGCPLPSLVSFHSERERPAASGERGRSDLVPAASGKDRQTAPARAGGNSAPEPAVDRCVPCVCVVPRRVACRLVVPPLVSSRLRLSLSLSSPAVWLSRSRAPAGVAAGERVCTTDMRATHTNASVPQAASSRAWWTPSRVECVYVAHCEVVEQMTARTASVTRNRAETKSACARREGRDRQRAHHIRAGHVTNKYTSAGKIASLCNARASVTSHKRVEFEDSWQITVYYCIFLEFRQFNLSRYTYSLRRTRLFSNDQTFAGSNRLGEL